jgi:uncharacterized HAD superfamily protein/adenine/guanine phosphoribosyltransferase-like PRPP-binding protein
MHQGASIARQGSLEIMFGYVSISQLSADIRAKLYLIPRDIDLIVGIPRSGMIPAYMIGLFTNRLVTDLETFLANGRAGHGSTRAVGAQLVEAFAAQHILLVDDSLRTGKSMKDCVARIRDAGFAGTVTTCAIIVVPEKGIEVDLFFREMPHPRIFEWNAFHHPQICDSCFDLDGILCVDPTSHDNDDGPRYLDFLRSARPLIVPTQRIGHIVSARLEKYRPQTEQWLADHGIAYDQLHLIDLPSAAERQRLGTHASHKAKIYQDTNAILFYESDVKQAREIAHLSGKPVLCIADMSLYLPGGLQLDSHIRNAKWHLERPIGRLKGWLRKQKARLRGAKRSPRAI